MNSLAHFEEQNKNRSINDISRIVNFENYQESHPNNEIMEQNENFHTNNNFSVSSEHPETSSIDVEWNMEPGVSFERDSLQNDSICIIDVDVEECEQNKNYCIEPSVSIPNDRHDPYPIYADNYMDCNVPFDRNDCVSTIDLMPDKDKFKEIPISDQQADSTVFYKEYEPGADIIDISSESDDDVKESDEVAESFYCYFCDAVFYSLSDLGVHVKTCAE